MTEAALPRSRSGESPLPVAIRAAREAGAILKTHFSLKKQVQCKGQRNLVTEGDLLAEKAIIALIKKEFPDHAILSEESGKTEGDSDYCWVVDPLDGTTNYAFGIPFFAVSIALAFRDDVLLGAVYDPLRDEMFRVEKGAGAFLNDSRISVAPDRNLRTTVIGLDLGYNDACTRDMLTQLSNLWSGEIVFRLLGSAALGLTYVACGRLDVYLHAHLYPWDTAAAMLMIREAGGEVTDWECKPATIRDTRIFACRDIAAHEGIRSELASPGDG